MINIEKNIAYEDKVEEIDSYWINSSEKSLKNFCDRIRITLIYLYQSPSSFSGIMRQKGGKRPDFKIITPFEEIYVDMKTRKSSKIMKYTIDIENLTKLEISERLLQKSIYLAYSIDIWYIGKDWGFISIRKVCELRERQQHIIDKGYKFVGIDYEELKRYNELL